MKRVTRPPTVASAGRVDRVDAGENGGCMVAGMVAGWSLDGAMQSQCRLWVGFDSFFCQSGQSEPRVQVGLAAFANGPASRFHQVASRDA
jgi:hypothetical protein